MSQKILLLHTGGTISMSEDATGHVAPAAGNPLSTIDRLFPDSIHVTAVELMHVPSPHITTKEMMDIKNAIEQHYQQQRYDGVVITHGTDTLEETAYFLDLTITVPIPIVVTGAMRSSNELGADGLTNLQNAVLTAADAASWGKGVLVVMNDEIHSARHVTKTHTTNLATFQSPTFGPLGLLSKKQVRYFQQLTTTEHYPITALERDTIYLLKAYAGMDGTLFDLVNTPQTDGVVIEALGAGNLPPQCVPAVKRLLANNIPVVLVSRAFNGVTQDVYDYPGGGKQLHDAGVLFTTGLSGQKARLKLLVLRNSTLTKPLAHYFR